MEKIKYSVKSKENNQVTLLKQQRADKERILADTERKAQENKIRLVSLGEKISKLNELTSQRHKFLTMHHVQIVLKMASRVIY